MSKLCMCNAAFLTTFLSSVLEIFETSGLLNYKLETSTFEHVFFFFFFPVFAIGLS